MIPHSLRTYLSYSCVGPPWKTVLSSSWNCRTRQDLIDVFLFLSYCGPQCTSVHPSTHLPEFSLQAFLQPNSIYHQCFRTELGLCISFLPVSYSRSHKRKRKENLLWNSKHEFLLVCSDPFLALVLKARICVINWWIPDIHQTFWIKCKTDFCGNSESQNKLHTKLVRTHK